VERGTGKGYTWVWRTPKQKWDSKMIEPEKLGKDISIMIWGAIWLGSRSDLVVMERDEDAPRGGYTARSYLKVLEDQIPRIYEPNLIFMKDGARIHTAELIKNWLEENNISTLPWPAYSPDLNPIENLWAILKALLIKKHPELLDMGASQVAINQFAQAINEAWHSIPQEIIDNLIKSMDSRVNHCLIAEGWQTRY
jgi:transposase